MNINLTGARLRPGDKVLIAFREYAHGPEFKEVQTALEARFPGVSFTFVAGVEQVVVQPRYEAKPLQV